MAPGTDAGDYSYTTNGTIFQLVGYGSNGTPVITVPWNSFVAAWAGEDRLHAVNPCYVPHSPQSRQASPTTEAAVGLFGRGEDQLEEADMKWRGVGLLLLAFGATATRRNGDRSKSVKSCIAVHARETVS